MRIVLIDDHPLVRRGLCSVLSLVDDIEVVGEASDTREAFEIINKTQPDIALVDLRLGEENGLDIIDKANKNSSNCKFIVLTSSADEHDFKKAKELGAKGYILKEALPDELIYAVHLVANGRKYYDPGIMDEIMNESNVYDIIEELTLREQEVLMALGEGLCNKDIANKLYISIYTVKKHVSQILAKLGLADRTQAALYVQMRGLQKIS